MLQLCDSLMGAGGVKSMLGPVWLMNHRVDWDMAQSLMSSSSVPQGYRGAYQRIVGLHVNGTAAVMQLHTAFRPRGPVAEAWVKSARQVILEWENANSAFSAGLGGGASKAVDTYTAVIHTMPLYLSITLVSIMTIVFCVFRMVLLPLRLGFALVFTLAATYSVAVVVYQTKLLHSVWPWLANYHGVAYQIVPFTFGITVALGLDYDIFLVSRIIEYRASGFDDRSSILKGVADTGGIISVAGVIMVLAFSGLLASKKVILHQYAVILITSVFLDAFVVRTVLVPALMFSAKSWNWWPQVMPE
jgi:hypothetical protein